MTLAPLPLHHTSCTKHPGCDCINDLHRFTQSILNVTNNGQHNGGRPARLTAEQREDATSHLYETAIRLSARYDANKATSTFRAYAQHIMRKRIADWYRKEFPGTRGGLRPTFEPVDTNHPTTDPELAATLETINTQTLTPEARHALKRIAQPMVEQGLRQTEVAAQHGYTRRQVASWMRALRQDLTQKTAA